MVESRFVEGEALEARCTREKTPEYSQKHINSRIAASSKDYLMKAAVPEPAIRLRCTMESGGV